MNLFKHTIPNIGEEFTTLFENKNIQIVKIVSSDKVEPKEYCQKENEFVFLLEGEATLEIDGKNKTLKKGDYIYIPSNTLHRVIKTQKGTLWLAIHFT